MKHTPGPFYTSARNGHTYVFAESDDFAIARVLRESHRDNDANARLIAAAPELLEALQSIFALVDTAAETGEYDEDAINAAYDKGRAAIAKALGENATFAP